MTKIGGLRDVHKIISFLANQLIYEGNPGNLRYALQFCSFVLRDEVFVWEWFSVFLPTKTRPFVLPALSARPTTVVRIIKSAATRNAYYSL